MAALGEPIISGGIRHTNYFQGRVLGAEDLAADQQAVHQHLAQLGQAIGPGVVRGLEVQVDATNPQAALTVDAGLAITAQGATIELPDRVVLPLVRGATQGGQPSEDGLFGPCGDAGPGVDLTGDGAYVLVISPGAGFAERAPKVGLNDDGVAGACGARYLVEGATLRLVPLPLAGRADMAGALSAIAALDDPASTAGAEESLLVVSRFRNRLAHLCLSNAAASGHAAALRAGAPEVFDTDPPLLADMAAGESPALRPCDVPLAVLYLDLFGLRFVDRWAARRMARPRIAPTSLSLFPEYGLERVLQFAEQMDDILRQTGSIANVRIGDYVRFVPPAAWFPAQGSGVAGFSPSQFLSPYTRGIVGRINAGQMADRLDASLRHGAIDLADGPCLLSYDLDENEAALISGQAGRRLRFFMSRTVNGPLQRDALALTLQGLWNASRGILRALESVTVPVQNPVTLRLFANAQEAVSDTANRYAAVALARALDDVDSLSSLQELLDLQRDMADRLQAIRFAASQSFSRFFINVNAILDQFVFGLRQRLNEALPDGAGLGLAQALNAGDVCAAIAAQDNINAYLAQLTGQGGASGTTRLARVSSPQGFTLVPGGPALPHIYVLENDTNRRLTFQLEADADAPNGDWGSAVTLTDLTGVPISEVAVQSRASARFQVSVAAPQNAVQGEPVTLNVRGFSPPPDLRQPSAEPLMLTVGDSQTEPVEQSIRIPEPAEPVLTQTVSSNATLTMPFTLLYEATSGPNDAMFDIAVVFDGAVNGWRVSIDDGNEIAEGPTGEFVRSMQLSAGERRVVSVSLQAPFAGLSAAGPPPVSLRLEARSSGLPTQITAASPPNGERFVLAVQP